MEQNNNDYGQLQGFGIILGQKKTDPEPNRPDQ